MKTEAIICLDIGGTNCRMGLVDRDMNLTECKIVSTEELTEGGLVCSLSRLIREYRAACEPSADIRAISMGFPATIDRGRRRVLQAPNIVGLGENIPICRVLEQELGIPVFLERDVNLLLLHDLQTLGLEKSSTIIGIYFGTGIGNSIYIDGKFLCGANGVAGELGHIPQMKEKVRCGCGNIGCIEPVGGGRRLSELCETRFKGTSIKDIYLLHGDTPELQEQIDAMAVAVATEVNILDPDYVVLGGGLLQMSGFPLELLEMRIREHTRKPYPMENLRLCYARPNQKNGIIGAGLYGWHCLNS